MLWSEKVGIVEGDDLSENEAVESGIMLEVPIAQWYGRKFDREVHVEPPFTLLRHPQHDFMLATLDAVQFIDGEKQVVEIKNTSFGPDAWEDRLPVHYEMQLIHQMVVTGCTKGTLVALHKGQYLRAYDRVLSPQVAETLIEAEAHFWQMVMAEQPPEPGPNSGDALKAMFPRAEIEDMVTLPAEFDDLETEIEKIKDEVDRLSERRDEIESRIKMLIGKHTGGITPQGIKYSWKNVQSVLKAQPERVVNSRRFTRSKSKD
jgi:predicted phage-related endonuclease